MTVQIPIARSDIHVHLSPEHIEALFGPGYSLTCLRNLTLPGQFACTETVPVRGPSGEISGVVVVGPARKKTQVEISVTNGLVLGIEPPVRDSGDTEGSPGCLLTGPAGTVELASGVIAARRHVHMHSRDARRWGLRDGQAVRVQVPGERSLIFDNVLLRSDDNQALEMHVDFDEGHAAGISDFQMVDLLLP